MDKREQQRLGKQLYKVCDRGGTVKEVNDLLLKGADVNWRDSSTDRTSLNVASLNGKSDIVRVLLKSSLNINQKSGAGDTALHKACLCGDMDCVKLLLATGQCDTAIVNNYRRTALQEAAHRGMQDVVKYLHSLDVNKPGVKERMLEQAVREGDMSFVKYLVTEQGMDVNVPGLIRAVLEQAINEGDVDFIKYLVCKQGVNVNEPDVVNRVLELTICEGDVDFFKYLVTEQNVEVNEHHLLIACEHQHAAVVEYLLTTHHINPNAEDSLQRTPLSLAKNKEVIKLLIQHGADSKNVYALHRKVLKNVFSKDPVKNPVKLFVIGHGGEGKSTLIEAMEHEPTFWTSVVNVFVAPKEVEGVDQRTAGIIPRVFKSRFFGDVHFFDFAGQEAYYSSHAAVIRSVVDTCPPVFILVIGLHRDDATITHSVFYWLGIMFNQCGKMEGKAPLIVVGSHADLVDCLESDHKTQVISQAVEKFPFFDLVSVVSLDCRYSNSSGMKLLRRCVETCCKSLRTQLSVNLNSHMFLIYLVEKYSNELALTLDKVQADLEAAVDQKPSKKHEEVYSFIPTTIERLREICVQLSDKGHILFLPSETPQGVSFIIIDKTALLAEINGTVFAPEDFKQHCQLSTSTGIVPRSKLAKRFTKFNATMLVRFLSHFELAVPIEDQKVIQLIDKHLDDKNFLTPVSEKFLFCPALIRLEAPSQTQVFQSKFLYNVGWVLSSVYSEHFFDARFLHVLILRLALSLGLAPVIDADIPALQHQCSVWKTGVCWSTSNGAEVLVEVVDKKKVVVLIQSDTVSCDLLKYRTNIVVKVRETAKELCSSVTTEELLLSAPDVTYPLNVSKTTALFSLKTVAQTLIGNDLFAVSINGIGRLPVSDHEVYANLGKNILQTLFNENDPVHTKKISDRFLSAVSSAWSKKPQLVDIICSAITPKADVTPQAVASVEKMEAVLKSWRKVSNGTYKSLRQILDQLSVFAGVNPLELAGIQYKVFDEKLLPNVQPTTRQPSHTAESGGTGLTDNSECLNPPTLSDHSNSAGLSIEDLKREYDVTSEQLNTKIREEDIYDLAGCFDCVETYLDKLGLTSGQQTQVEDLAERRDIQTAMTKALKFWRRPNPLSATYRTLLQILLDLKRGDVAVKICQYVKQEVPKHKTQ